MTSAEPLIEIAGLSIAYRVAGELRPVLREIDLTLGRGEVMGLVGEFGSGKSTILFAIMNYLAGNAQIESGTIRFGDRDLLRLDPRELGRIRGRRIAMIYQDAGAALNPAMRIGAQIAEVRRFHFRESEATAMQRASALLTTAGFDDPRRILASYPHQLSGGQRQRAMIATALAGEPEILLMDEPTTALDVEVQARILALVRDLKERTGVSILFVSHDLAAIARVADRIGVLYDGELMEIGPADAILKRPRNPYTRALLAALPRVDAKTTLSGIPGTASKAPSRFAHCVFIERCGLAAPICTERPALLALREPSRQSRCHFAEDPARLAQWPAPRDELGAETTPSPAPALLEVLDLSVEYHRWAGFRRRHLLALQQVSFRVPRGRVVAVVGESGSGKSTLARSLLRLEAARAGRVLFEGADVFSLDAEKLRRFRQRVQIVFQNPASSLNPRKTVGEIVLRPLRLAGIAAASAQAQARDMLAAVGLDPGIMLGRHPDELSGGEKQRVAIARAFVTKPALVVLDEPTTALDASVQAGVLNLLERLRAELGCTYLLISHDLAVVRHIADEVIVMRAGEICEIGSGAQIFHAPQHPYTRALLAAAPRL